MASRDVLKLSETFSSLQGEGRSTGAPAFFVRLALCNLRCEFCDTRYTWDFERFDYAREVRTVPVAAVAEAIAAAPERRVIVTGGEPLLQRAALEALLEQVPDDVLVEVETNGTLAPGPFLERRVAQWNVSPKLASAGDPEHKRIRRSTLLVLRDTGRADLKLVVRDRADVTEALALATSLEWPRDRVWLMPEAASRAEHDARAPDVAAACSEHGVRFSPRLHVVLWGGERGR
ncbi:MAG TPA: 7-carboxy-7-deazaguanine synthase QueE [Polyangiaceae bacterium]|nr:7-carboxy-7-deazaguanine synthase QueE [Polyangiaceae bacterium]